ncbi:MAG: ATP-binding protein [Spirochaetales bacterium]|nr:ATP-binding protein [Spirochaetales bacterium]
MAFIGGPRQVGKTTVAQNLSKSYNNTVYLNWDSRNDRETIIKEAWNPEADLLSFDELHKYEKWKSYIKGIWDTQKEHKKIIVTGSSRLDIFRRGGDSLLGRYRYYRLHPFSLREINEKSDYNVAYNKNMFQLKFPNPAKGLETLFKFGGFPEPFLSQSDIDLQRWQNERFERIFREDIRDVENIQHISKVELLGHLLTKRTASPLSLASLKDDVSASPATIIKWIELLCINYFIFKVPPYHKRLERALKKESKYYLWDWSEISNDGDKFENLLAVHLLKFCHYQHDIFGIRCELFYLRDREKREVDFLLTWNEAPWMLIESKLNKPDNVKNINYFSQKLKVPWSYVVTFSEDADYIDKQTKCRIVPASKFLMAMA